MKTKHLFFIIFLLLAAIPSNSFAQDNTQVGLPDGAIARLGKGGINIMRFSPDGSYLAVGTDVGVWLYDVPDGKETPLYTENIDVIRALAFSPDGKMLATYGRNNATLQLWDINIGLDQPPLTFPDSPGLIHELVFSQDNQTLLGLGELGYMAEWNTKTGERLSTKKLGRRKSVTSFSQFGKTFVFGNPEKDEIRLWDVDSESLGEVFKEKSNPTLGKSISKILGGNPNERRGPQGVETVAYSPDNKTIASAHIGNTIKLWDTTTREQRFSLKGHREIIYTFAFSPDSKILASGSSDNKIMLWDVEKGHLVSTLSGHKNTVKTLAFSPTQNGLLASGSADGTVRFWDTNAGKELSVFATGHTESIEAVAFSINDTILCSAASNGTVQIWDVQSGKKLPSPSVLHYDSNSALALSQDATLFVCNGQDNIVRSRVGGTSMYQRSHRETRLSSLPTGDELRSFPHASIELALSPDNNVLAAVLYREQAVQLWNINSGAKLFSFGIALSLQEKLIFSPNSQYLFMYGDQDQTQLWHVPTQEKIDIPIGKEIMALAFSPDSMTIAVAHPNADGLRVISLWHITPTKIEKHKEIIPKFRGGYTAKLLFSPDGKTLLHVHSSGWEDILILLDIETDIELGTVSGHTNDIKTLVFSHDGKTLASGSEDGTILLWDWDKIIAKAQKIKEID